MVYFVQELFDKKWIHPKKVHSHIINICPCISATFTGYSDMDDSSQCGSGSVFKV